jgi:hypothetical protein
MSFLVVVFYVIIIFISLIIVYQSIPQLQALVETNLSVGFTARLNRFLNDHDYELSSALCNHRPGGCALYNGDSSLPGHVWHKGKLIRM